MFKWSLFKMASFHSFVLVLFISLVLRSVLFMFGIHDWIYSRIELTTPITSWKRGQFILLKWGVFYKKLH